MEISPQIENTSFSASKRVPQLDGIRGFAVFLVLLWHFYVPIKLPENWLILKNFQHLLSTSWSGVDLFFVLSGFLIGGILIDAQKSSNYFAIFYWRRCCRIFPLYGLLLLFCGISFWWMPKDTALFLDWEYFKDVPFWSYATFTQNFFMAEHLNFGPRWLGVTWSLAIEEQFYLILPFLIRFIPPQKLPYLLLLFIFSVPFFRLFLIHLGDFTYKGIFFLLPVRMDELLIGTFLAWLVRQPLAVDQLKKHIWFLYSLFFVFGSVIFLFSSVLKIQPGDVILAHFGYTWFGLFYANILLIGLFSPNKFIQAIYCWKPLRRLGAISYFVYLFHIICLDITIYLLYGSWDFIEKPSVLSLFLALILVFTTATLSWLFLEKPLLKWGHHFQYKFPSNPPKTIS